MAFENIPNPKLLRLRIQELEAEVQENSPNEELEFRRKELSDYLNELTASFGTVMEMCNPTTPKTIIDHTKTKDRVCSWLHGVNAK